MSNVNFRLSKENVENIAARLVNKKTEHSARELRKTKYERWLRTYQAPSNLKEEGLLMSTNPKTFSQNFTDSLTLLHTNETWFSESRGRGIADESISTFPISLFLSLILTLSTGKCQMLFAATVVQRKLHHNELIQRHKLSSSLDLITC